MNTKDIRVTRGELYALLLLSFTLVAALAACGLFRTTVTGFAIGTFVIGVILLPMQRVLVRTYYGREVPVLSSIVWMAGATVLVFGGWWVVQRVLQ